MRVAHLRTGYVRLERALLFFLPLLLLSHRLQLALALQLVLDEVVDAVARCCAACCALFSNGNRGCIERGAEGEVDVRRRRDRAAGRAQQALLGRVRQPLLNLYAVRVDHRPVTSRFGN